VLSVEHERFRNPDQLELAPIQEKAQKFIFVPNRNDGLRDPLEHFSGVSRRRAVKYEQRFVAEDTPCFRAHQWAHEVVLEYSARFINQAEMRVEPNGTGPKTFRDEARDTVGQGDVVTRTENDQVTP